MFLLLPCSSSLLLLYSFVFCFFHVDPWIYLLAQSLRTKLTLVFCCHARTKLRVKALQIIFEVDFIASCTQLVRPTRTIFFLFSCRPKDASKFCILVAAFRFVLTISLGLPVKTSQSQNVLGSKRPQTKVKTSSVNLLIFYLNI